MRRRMFERLLTLRNEVGLLAEEYDPVAKRMVGNFPQAFSHIALVHAAFAISGQWKPEPSTKTKGLNRGRTTPGWNTADGTSLASNQASDNSSAALFS